MNQNSFVNYLFKKEDDLLDTYNDSIRLEIANEQLMNSNDDELIDRLEESTNLSKLITKDESMKANDDERIKQLWVFTFSDPFSHLLSYTELVLLIGPNL